MSVEIITFPILKAGERPASAEHSPAARPHCRLDEVSRLPSLLAPVLCQLVAEECELSAEFLERCSPHTPQVGDLGHPKTQYILDGARVVLCQDTASPARNI